ncbi:MAG: ATP-binding protein [bacterium]|nr:ATP-binding protein [bacterium]
MKTAEHEFLRTAGRILNSGQSRTLLLTGNVYDLFCLPTEDGRGEYVPLVDLLTRRWSVSGKILIVYELNGPIRFAREADREKIKNAWLRWRTGLDANEIAVERMLSADKAILQHDAVREAYEANLRSAIGNPTVALELLRQMCLCSRTELSGRPILAEDLVVVIEAADFVIPEGDIAGLSDADRHRVSICHDWFSDPGFTCAQDSVLLIAESRSLLNHRVARLPHILEVEAPAPDEATRRHFITWFNQGLEKGEKLKLWGSQQELARFTAGLTVQALAQLLKGAIHQREKLTQEQVVTKVETFIKSQLGDDIVEFKKPGHRLKDVVGFTGLKAFLTKELIPRFQSSGPDALPGAAVAGPIGGGKTFIFEAVAAELDMVVLVLKNIRSQWFGQTDVVFERLRRVLDALAKVLIFVDEADTQFGGVGPETHATERRLTGKIQALMSDPESRGKVIWLLMTARIHLLSPDIRRPGRVGDLIIPVLDPEGDDRDAFLGWVLGPVLEGRPGEQDLAALREATEGYSAASYASLRSELRAKSAALGVRLTVDQIVETVSDLIPPAIGETRRYQTLQALVNCTRRSLLPDPAVSEDQRRSWSAEIRSLEARGIR